jgi:hypothetical protein
MLAPMQEKSTSKKLRCFEIRYGSLPTYFESVVTGPTSCSDVIEAARWVSSFEFAALGVRGHYGCCILYRLVAGKRWLIPKEVLNAVKELPNLCRLER